jgi:hypothetical protein
MRRLWVVIAVVLGSVLSARADEPESQQYSEVVNEAISEFNATRFAESRALFMRAHELSPSARTLRGLGATEFELRNYGLSVRYLTDALASDVRPLEGELRARTEKLLERARGFVARLDLTVLPSSSYATVDGEVVENGRELLLDAGEHVIDIEAPGYVPLRRVMNVRAGESEHLHVVLTMRIDSAPVAAPHDDRKRLVQNPWLWSGVGALVAGGAVALALSLRARDPSYDRGSTGVLVPPPHH